jgi:hypothetical protein
MSQLSKMVRVNPTTTMNKLPRLNTTSLLHNTLLGAVQGKVQQAKATGSLYNSVTGQKNDLGPNYQAEMTND